MRCGFSCRECAAMSPHKNSVFDCTPAANGPASPATTPVCAVLRQPIYRGSQATVQRLANAGASFDSVIIVCILSISAVAVCLSCCSATYTIMRRRRHKIVEAVVGPRHEQRALRAAGGGRDARRHAERRGERRELAGLGSGIAPGWPHSTRWKNTARSVSRCWSACRMLPPRAKTQPATRATRPGRSGPCSRAMSVGGGVYPSKEMCFQRSAAGQRRKSTAAMQKCY